jgi:hypothetical protein
LLIPPFFMASAYSVLDAMADCEDLPYRRGASDRVA